MKKLHVILAWIDDDYRENLTEEQKKGLPESPAGYPDLRGSEFDIVIPGALFGHDSSKEKCTPVTVCKTAKGEPACVKVFTLDV